MLALPVPLLALPELLLGEHASAEARFAGVFAMLLVKSVSERVRARRASSAAVCAVPCRARVAIAVDAPRGGGLCRAATIAMLLCRAATVAMLRDSVAVDVESLWQAGVALSVVAGCWKTFAWPRKTVSTDRRRRQKLGVRAEGSEQGLGRFGEIFFEKGPTCVGTGKKSKLCYMK